jgi:hypothetical protein
MGPGVGLEVGNTIYFDMPRDQFAYWNTDDRGRATVRALIQSGHVDCLHSFGDLATSRAHAARALDELARHDCMLRVWIDHAVAPTNFGADIMRGLGDVEGAAPFHADLSHSYGIRYVWRGRVTSVIGQNARHSLAGVFDPRHAAGSAVTVSKELVKRAIGSRGAAKYAMNAANELLRPITLRSGHPVLEFVRANPSWAGVSRFDTSTGLAEVLTNRFLARLERRAAPCILYTHLGKTSRTDVSFEEPTRRALRTLAEWQRAGRILVTTTRRLLDFQRHIAASRVSITETGNRTLADVSAHGIDGERLGVADLAGLSVYVADPARTDVRVNGQAVNDLQRNPPDFTGRASVSIPWRRLEFPCL